VLNYCILAEARFLKYVQLQIERASPYVDRFIVVEDGTLGNVDFHRDNVVLLSRKWDNNHAAQRNVYIDYIKKTDPEGWCLVMDDDEFPSLSLLSKLRELTTTGRDGYSLPSFDIRIPSVITPDPVEVFFFNSKPEVLDAGPGITPPQDVQDIMSKLGIAQYSYREQTDFRKLNFFQVHSSTKYTGYVHEALEGQLNTVPLDLPYYHIKTMMEVHESGARNYVEGGSGVNLLDKNPHWVELKGLVDVDWHKFREQYSTLFLLWLWDHVGDTGNQWSSETVDLYYHLKRGYIVPFPYSGPVHKLEIPNRWEIEELYHAILNRDPDPEGLKNWVEQWYILPWDELMKRFMDSDEYKTKVKLGIFKTAV